MTLTEAAKILSMTPDGLRMAIKRKTLKAERRSFGWLVESDEVERYRAEVLGKRGRPRGKK